MGFFRFIFSKTFLLQLLLAAIILVVIGFLFLKWLDYSTNQDQQIEVPNLTGLSLTVAENKASERDLRIEVLDSASYDPNYPPYSVIDQAPEEGALVKENRKIYLTLNPSGYREVEIPEGLIRRTRRQVVPTLRSLGFEIGEITYEPDLAKDAVLELRHRGRELQPGDRLKETSVIDLVLGDGTGRYEDPDDENVTIETDAPDVDVRANLNEINNGN